MRSPVKYSSYAELKQHECEGRDYSIKLRHGRSGILVIAPHGGNIEPGCSEIADAVAAKEHSFYALEGLKPAGNWNLHIASTHFDEPVCMKALGNARRVLTIHGCKDEAEIVYLGGTDHSLRETVKKSLETSGFATGVRDGIQGRSELNLCNRSSSGRGVQLEIAFALRSKMFANLKLDGRRHKTEVFNHFVAALRDALAEGGGQKT
ncbi:MAG: poly-gamma-glutamate hydrolase family protein [Desulforhabdus sp.]|jgi:phage replication-related protein YjqB (UPF0714/DUF867 family)|nr:poly-gamma-glutamate hydrolase family protein [Desulforhabdus sp.]